MQKQKNDSGYNQQWRGRGRGRGRDCGRGGGQGQSGSPSTQGRQDRGRSSEPSVYDGEEHTPSEEIARIENSINPDPWDSEPPDLSRLSLDNRNLLQRRYDYGADGKEVKLWANYFQISGIDKLTLYQHSVTIADESNRPPPQVKRRLFSSMLKSADLADKNTATNYTNRLVCTTDLDSRQILVSDPEYPSQSYNLVVQRERVFHFRDLLDYLKSPQETTFDSDEKHEATQVLNIVLTRFPNESEGVQPVGQSKHFKLQQQGEDLGGGLVARGGLFHSTRPSTGRLLLNVNFTAAAFYCEVGLNDLVNSLKPNGSIFSDRNVARKVNSLLKNLRVKITYPGGAPKEDVVVSLALRNRLALRPSDVKAEQNHGLPSRIVPISDYFLEEYGFRLQPNQVMVHIEREPSFIPAEICTVLPGQLARQRLNAEQTPRMIKFACKPPHQNANDIDRDGKELMGATDASNVDSPNQRFGIHISQQLLAVNGRQLGWPRLSYHGRTSTVPDSGSWNLKDIWLNKPVSFPHSGKDVEFRVLVLRHPQQEAVNSLHFTEQLKGHLHSRGLDLGNDNLWREDVVELQANRTGNDQMLDQKFEKLKRERTKLIVVVLADKDAQLFSRIKYLADVKYGIHTLCIQPKFDSKTRRMQLNTGPYYLANLALKINLKLGGVNHQLMRETTALMGKTMFIGVDVTHPTGSEASSKAPSIACVVANVDQTLGQWPASIRAQGHRVELVAEIKDMVMERLSSWREQYPPERIIVYRDGVSESQYQDVLDTEFTQVKEAVEKFFEKGKTKPKVTILVVGKRHHTRFYPSKEGPMDQKTGNVIPGTVVDRGCTMESGFDFFMVAHQGIQGTSRPAHYVVLRDEGGYSADDIQNMTHNLCYVFGRATRAVSVATPAYYADIACERGRCYLYGYFHPDEAAESGETGDTAWSWDVHDDLKESMFYI